MARMERVTRNVRGADMFGLKPKNNIILYDDNCTVHGNEEQQQALERKKINERNLIPNATHIQQPVDQHVGVWYKDQVKDLYGDWVEEVWDKWDKKIITKKVSSKERRAKICELSFECAKQLAEQQHLMQASWINLGVDLPFDGSKDGDATTLHKDGMRGKDRLDEADLEEASDLDSEETDSDIGTDDDV